MKRIHPMLLLVVAIFFGGSAAYMASGWLKAKSGKANQAALQKVQMVPVVVASKDIVAGSLLDAGLLKVVDWPRDSQIAGAVDNLELLNGRVTRYPLVSGEMILESKLAPQGTPGGLAGIIENDKRAVSVKVDEASGVAGFVMPGNRVDVLLTMDRNEFKDDPVTKAVLQNILVLGKGQETDVPKSGEKPKIVPTVTLQVTPEEGERLALAAKEGQITLALRGWVENVLVPSTGVRISGLIKNDKKSEPAFESPISPAIAPQKKPGVEMLRGTERQIVEF